MILNKKPLTLAEVKEYLKSSEGNEVLAKYLKTFCKIGKKDSDEIRRLIISLNNLKIKEENIVKIIDFLPKDSEEINKIFSEANLSEEEANGILDIVKKY